MYSLADDDKLHEECGVFGIYGHPESAAMTALGLHALQHRGQEAAGIVSYDGTDFYRIPAYKPGQVVDATGCGDTYTIGYLYQRVSGASIEEAGRFAAAMSTLKIEKSGPFCGNKEDVIRCMETAEQMY